MSMSMSMLTSARPPLTTTNANTNTNTNRHYYLLGHRGARAECLENTKLGFSHATQLHHLGKTLDGVEFDIQMTADGQFVVVHDETLTRLCGQQAWIIDHTLAELTHFVQTDWQRATSQGGDVANFTHQAILPLADVLPYLTKFCHIELEIKTHGRSDVAMLAKNLLRLLSQPAWQALSITLTSFDTELLTQLQLQQAGGSKRYPTGLLLEPNTTLASQIPFLPLPTVAGEQQIYTTFNFACELDCSQVGIYYALITPNVMQLAHRLGLNVSAWTVNDIEVATRLIAMGVDCVITDYPSQFLAKL